MKRQLYELLESYMHSCMDGSAHDTQHVYRVLYSALKIAAGEQDVGRPDQLADPKVCHAQVGADKACVFLTGLGLADTFIQQVCHCIRTHRFSNRCTPQTIEAKILFDADKLDVTGLIGIARTLQYQGQHDEPLYTLGSDGMPGDGTGETKPSFFQEYKRKLEPLYDTFYTATGAAMAQEHKKAAQNFYHTLYRQVSQGFGEGMQALDTLLE